MQLTREADCNDQQQSTQQRPDDGRSDDASRGRHWKQNRAHLVALCMVRKVKRARRTDAVLLVAVVLAVVVAVAHVRLADAVAVRAQERSVVVVALERRCNIKTPTLDTFCMNEV